MLNYTSKSYGDDDFINRIAGNDNRLESLQSTDLLIQSALVPNSRVRSNKEAASNDAAVYIGHLDKIYTVPISAAYIINASSTSYQYSAELDDMDVSMSQTPKAHSFEDWEDFHLYPGDNGKVYTDQITESKSTLSPAFGSGKDSTLVQVAAISSAAAGAGSPLVPSLFSQFTSPIGYQLEQQNATAALKLFEQAVARIYNEPILDKFAVCNQWPSGCGLSDGVFIDGGFVDNPALVINIAQYQIAGGDVDDTLRVILTNTNQAWGTDYQYSLFLQYFNSPINDGIEPGAYIWPSGMLTPYQSHQIFGEFMDKSILDGLIEPIPDSNMTTALLKGTTIDNPVFGIKAGKSALVLFYDANSCVPYEVLRSECFIWPLCTFI